MKFLSCYGSDASIYLRNAERCCYFLTDHSIQKGWAYLFIHCGLLFCLISGGPHSLPCAAILSSTVWPGLLNIHLIFCWGEKGLVQDCSAHMPLEFKMQFSIPDLKLLCLTSLNRTGQAVRVSPGRVLNSLGSTRNSSRCAKSSGSVTSGAWRLRP